MQTVNPLQVLKAALPLLFVFGCANSPEQPKALASTASDSVKVEEIRSAPQPQYPKLKSFSEVEKTKARLSGVGVGAMGAWMKDELGYRSITPYYEFGTSPKNNLAFYLESPALSSIRGLTLVLNINNQDKGGALEKFTDIIAKTYVALRLTPSKRILNAAREGREIVVKKDTFTASIVREVSSKETYKFLLESQ
jgi:hypothetical protein